MRHGRTGYGWAVELSNRGSKRKGGGVCGKVDISAEEGKRDRESARKAE